MTEVTPDDIETVVSVNLDDDGNMWFTSYLKDGRLVSICWELDTVTEIPPLEPDSR